MCCGSGAISIELFNRGVNPLNIYMVDKSPWGLFWQRIGDSTFSTEVFKFYIDDVPEDITKIKKYAKEMVKRPANDGLFDNMVYKFLILQACAFGSSATWVENNEWKKSGGLRDYWLPTETSKRRSPVNPMMPMPETLYKRVCDIAYEMDSINGYYGDVNDIQIDTNNSIIYIDPPYENTAYYGYTFDYMDFVNKLNTKVYLSEGKKLTEKAYLLSNGRKKGGINGNRVKANEEWLNVFE